MHRCCFWSQYMLNNMTFYRSWDWILELFPSFWPSLAFFRASSLCESWRPDVTNLEESQWCPKVWEELKYPFSAAVKFCVKNCNAVCVHHVCYFLIYCLYGIAVYMKLYISNGSPIQVIFDMKPQVQDFVLDTVKLRKLNFAIKLLTCNVNFTVRHSFRAWNVKC